VHSIELLLDRAADLAIRETWQALAEADLPSQGRHTGPTNAPHVTLLARPSIDPGHDVALAAVAAEALPAPVVPGGLVVFGRGPRGFVLARLVVVDTRILHVHRRVHEAAGGSDEEVESTRPGSWTPHITLASRLTPGQLAPAVDIAASAPALADVVAGSLRRWDSTEKTVTPLGP
jgi:2'-5' RNA ligase